jgi:hypothetical protein
MIRDEWRRIDLIEIFDQIDQIEIPMATPECTWDEMAQCFYVIIGSKTDIWLRLNGI